MRKKPRTGYLVVRFMKYTYIILIFILSQSSVVADDKYTNNIYTSVTLLYWCTYKEVPKNKKDISKVTNIDEPNKNITISFNDWLSELTYRTNDNVMVIANGNRTSTSNCDSIEIIKK